MDRLARDNPETFFRREPVAAQQAFSAFGAAIRHFYPLRQHCLAGQIQNLPARIRLSTTSSVELSKDAAGQFHARIISP